MEIFLKHLKNVGSANKDDNKDNDGDSDTLKEEGQILPPSTQQAGHQGGPSFSNILSGWPHPGSLGKPEGQTRGGS